jgi:hypothetical protein
MGDHPVVWAMNITGRGTSTSSSAIMEAAGQRELPELFLNAIHWAAE